MKTAFRCLRETNNHLSTPYPGKEPDEISRHHTLLYRTAKSMVDTIWCKAVRSHKRGRQPKHACILPSRWTQLNHKGGWGNMFPSLNPATIPLFADCQFAPTPLPPHLLTLEAQSILWYSLNIQLLSPCSYLYKIVQSKFVDHPLFFLYSRTRVCQLRFHSNVVE